MIVLRIVNGEVNLTGWGFVLFVILVGLVGK